MGKRVRPGKHRWIVSEWLEEVDGTELWLTVIAVVGWVVLVGVWVFRG